MAMASVMRQRFSGQKSTDFRNDTDISCDSNNTFMGDESWDGSSLATAHVGD